MSYHYFMEYVRNKMEEPKFIYESDKILFAFMYNYIQAEGKEKKDAALKRLSDAILKLMKDQAVVSTLFVNTNGSMINPNKEVNEKDFKLTTLKHSNGKEYIPLFLVSDRLTDIRYEIDSLETKIKNYDLLVNYSTLNIGITETKVYTKTNDNFFSKLGLNFVNGWSNFVNVLQDIILGIVYNLWIVILVVVVIVGIVIYRKKRNK